jgi:hypothetical protein
MVDEILAYIEKSSGLKCKDDGQGKLVLVQNIDNKIYKLSKSEISEVMIREDVEGRKFLQVNYHSGLKVLITDTLVGFKPAEIAGLDMGRIPKVVTTPDLLSVFEAIEEGVGVDPEIETLKKVFFSILLGAESVGFELSNEKKWITRLIASKHKVSI